MADQGNSWGRIRWLGYLFPPLGIFLVWKNSALALRTRVQATVGLLLYSLIYATGVIVLLITFTGLELEWQGGFPPVLTFSKTKPNYDAVEKHRAAHGRSSDQGHVPTTKQARSAYWNGFRGPRRDGHYTEQLVATNWPGAGVAQVWKQPCGSGYASFAIAEGLAFTIEQRRETETVVAYDTDTGAEIWTQVYNAHFDEPMGGEGPRATPAYDSGKLYSLGAMGDFFCLESATGKALWQKNIFTENRAEIPTYGASASPLIIEEKVIVCPGGANERSVVALHKETGAFIWGALNDPAAYSSPMLVDFFGESHLLIVTAERAAGLDPKNGALLWQFPWVVNQGNRNNAQPVLIGTNRFLLSAGYGTGSVGVEIKKTPNGFQAVELWRNKFLKNKFSSSVYWQGHIYGLDEDILTCLDASTGERKWKDGRYGYGQIVLASGCLIVLAGDGQLALVDAKPDAWHERTRFPALRGKTWNHPALSEGRLFIRNMVEMGCFDLSR
jgi:outer membrane protein assembly factor BamB